MLQTPLVCTVCLQLRCGSSCPHEGTPGVLIIIEERRSNIAVSPGYDSFPAVTISGDRTTIATFVLPTIFLLTLWKECEFTVANSTSRSD
jgi:hypothetical protein